MDKKHISASLLPTLLLMGCGPAPNDTESPPMASSAVNDAAVNQPPEHAPANANVMIDTMAPPILTPEAEQSVKGARNVLLSFARAIEQQKFDEAWALLSPGDQQKWSKQQFATNFAGLKDITVAIPTGTTEGAAGSIYYTAPVTITASDEEGRPIRMEGEAVLRRVNNVDGATPAQLRWHFNTLTLDWTH